MSTKNVRRSNKSKIDKATNNGLEIYQDDTDNLLYYKDINGRVIPLDSGGLASVTSNATLSGAGTVLSPLGVVPVPLIDVAVEMSYASSDATTPLVVANNIGGMFATHDMTIDSVFAGVAIVGSGGGITDIDILVNGVSIFSGALTELTIDSGEATSLTAATQPSIANPIISKGDRISTNITTLTTGGTEAGLQITLNGIRT